MKKIFWTCFAGVFVTALLSIIFFIEISRPSLHILKSWEQPPSVRYNSFDPYYLHIVEDTLDFGHVPYSVKRRYFIYVGKEAKNLTHGHVKDYSFDPEIEGMEKFLNRSNVSWDENGVTFTEPDGHRLFIPKDSFLGAR